MDCQYPLSPRARRSGQGWSDACPAHHDRNNSLSVSVGRDGRLLLCCHAGCTFAEIIAAAGMTPQQIHAKASPSAQRSQKIRDDAKADRKRADALAIWDSCRPIKETLGETYLASRGIRQGFDALRFHDALKHGDDGQLYPCIVGKVERGSEMVGVHRTFLTADGVKKDRRMLGACSGGAVRLSEGPRGIVVAEGIETALSAMALHHPEGFSIWAALSAPGIKALQLPLEPSSLYTYADGDEAGTTACLQLGGRAGQLGWYSRTSVSPKSRDLNDELKEREGLK